MKRILILTILLSLIWQVGAAAIDYGVDYAVSDADAKAKASELIAKARAALGGENKLKSIQSLQISGTYRRLLGDRETAGEIEYEILLPDKVKRTETMNPMPNISITRIDVLNGEQVWSDSQSGGMGGMVMIRRGSDNESPEMRAQMQKAMENSIRSDFARTMLSLLLSAPAQFPVEFSWAGEAEAPDGKADAIDITGPNNFATRIFIDQNTHKPLMISYRGRQPRVMMQTVSMGARSREEAEKQAKENAEKSAAEATAAPEVEFQVSFDDYRSVNGVEFPHTLTKMVDGNVTEEVTFKKLKVNAAIKPQTFEKK